MNYVFVYGTLRKGYHANDILEGCTYKGEAKLQSTPILIDPETNRPEHRRREGGVAIMVAPGHRSFPAVVHLDLETASSVFDPDLYAVPTPIGEVYGVPDDIYYDVMRALDSYEGYPHLYRRASMNTVVRDMEDGYIQSLNVQYYYMPLALAEIRRMELVATGDWNNPELTTLDDYSSRCNDDGTMDDVEYA